MNRLRLIALLFALVLLVFSGCQRQIQVHSIPGRDVPQTSAGSGSSKTAGVPTSTPRPSRTPRPENAAKSEIVTEVILAIETPLGTFEGIYSGEVSNGIPNGEGKFYTHEGELVYAGVFVNGKPSGELKTSVIAPTDAPARNTSNSEGVVDEYEEATDFFSHPDYATDYWDYMDLYDFAKMESLVSKYIKSENPSENDIAFEIKNVFNESKIVSLMKKCKISSYLIEVEEYIPLDERNVKNSQGEVASEIYIYYKGVEKSSNKIGVLPFLLAGDAYYGLGLRVKESDFQDKMYMCEVVVDEETIFEGSPGETMGDVGFNNNGEVTILWLSCGMDPDVVDQIILAGKGSLRLSVDDGKPTNRAISAKEIDALKTIRDLESAIARLKEIS